MPLLRFGVRARDSRDFESRRTQARPVGDSPLIPAYCCESSYSVASAAPVRCLSRAQSRRFRMRRVPCGSEDSCRTPGSARLCPPERWSTSVRAFSPIARPLQRRLPTTVAVRNLRKTELKQRAPLRALINPEVDSSCLIAKLRIRVENVNEPVRIVWRVHQLRRPPSIRTCEEIDGDHPEAIGIE